MGTTTFFEGRLYDQHNGERIKIEFGRSSFYAGRTLDDGRVGEESMYLMVGSTSVLVSRADAEAFLGAAIALAQSLKLAGQT